MTQEEKEKLEASVENAKNKLEKGRIRDPKVRATMVRILNHDERLLREERYKHLAEEKKVTLTVPEEKKEA